MPSSNGYILVLLAFAEISREEALIFKIVIELLVIGFRLKGLVTVELPSPLLIAYAHHAVRWYYII
jgi:hypothetical protein